MRPSVAVDTGLSALPLLSVDIWLFVYSKQGVALMGRNTTGPPSRVAPW